MLVVVIGEEEDEVEEDEEEIGVKAGRLTGTEEGPK